MTKDERLEPTADGKAPAFQFYARDFATGTIALSAEAVGVYMRLLCQQWEKGTLPQDLELLARIGGVSLARMRRLWFHLQGYFSADPGNPGGAIINVRLERERVKQAEFRQRQRENGQRGGRPAKGSSNADTEEPTPNPTLLSGLTQTEPTPKPKANPNESSALCSLPSAEEREKSGVSPREAYNADLADRAGQFIEFYVNLYPRLRNGVPYRRKDALEFPTAQSLVATWPDDRLHLMAEIFLRTDHKFAAEGNRSIKQFAGLAEWCDERLRVNGR